MTGPGELDVLVAIRERDGTFSRSDPGRRPFYSITKTFIAAALLRTGLDLDRPVSDWFGSDWVPDGRRISIRQLLTHSAGIRSANFRFPQDDWDTIITAICETQPEWEAGEEGGYHTQTTWFLLGELLHLIDGRTVDQYVRDEIFLTLGMHDSWLGMSPNTYNAYQQDGRLFDMPNTATATF